MLRPPLRLPRRRCRRDGPHVPRLLARTRLRGTGARVNEERAPLAALAVGRCCAGERRRGRRRGRGRVQGVAVHSRLIPSHRAEGGGKASMRPLIRRRCCFAIAERTGRNKPVCMALCCCCCCCCCCWLLHVAAVGILPFFVLRLPQIGTTVARCSGRAFSVVIGWFVRSLLSSRVSPA